MHVAALASDAAGFASAIGNRAFATAVAEAGGTAPLQRSSVDELRVRAAKGASDDAAIGELGILDKHQGITDAELDALHIDDLKALRRHTNALIEHHIQGHKSDDVPFWVEPAKLFVARRLEPRLAVKLRGGEMARLFWPIVEKLNETLGDGRIGKALLNVLPHTHRYLTTMTGKAPAAAAPSAQELGRIGTLGARFEIARLKWSREDSVPTPAELVATFDNAPRRFATLFADAVTEEDVLAAFKAAEADSGSVFRRRRPGARRCAPHPAREPDQDQAARAGRGLAAAGRELPGARRHRHRRHAACRQVRTLQGQPAGGR